MLETRPAGSRAKGLLVVGVGNLLLADEGFGIHLIRRLAAEGVPQEVDLLDGGTDGVDLLEPLLRYERVILIDAVRERGGRQDNRGVRDRDSEHPGCQRPEASRPGSLSPGRLVVFRLGGTELLNPDPSFSLHETSLGSLLRLGTALGYDLPSVTVVGFVPAELGWSTELSPAGRQALEDAHRLVREQIADLIAVA